MLLDGWKQITKDELFGNVIHLHNSNYNDSIARSVVVHEYMHYLQGRQRSDTDSINDIFDERYSWIIEGLADWFEELMYDDDNAYFWSSAFEEPLQQIMSKGFGLGDKSSSYVSMMFWKLVDQRCTGFRTKLPNLINDVNSNSIAEHVDDFLRTIDCDFGDHLNSPGTTKNSSLAAAIVFYEYATTYKNNIALLDSNELAAFDFAEGNVKSKENWTPISPASGVGESLGIGDNPVVDPYATYTVNLGDMWEKYDEVFKTVEDSRLRLKEAVLRIDISDALQDWPDMPHPIVSLINTNSNVIGNGVLGEVNHVTYDPQKLCDGEYVYALGEVGTGFLTILNQDPLFELFLNDVTFEIQDVAYKNEGNGLVTQRSHQVMWQDAPENVSLELTQSGARQHCENLVFGGYDDWMLPPSVDFLSYAWFDFNKTGGIFDFNSVSEQYWTGDPDNGDARNRNSVLGGAPQFTIAHSGGFSFKVRCGRRIDNLCYKEID